MSRSDEEHHDHSEHHHEPHDGHLLAHPPHHHHFAGQAPRVITQAILVTFLFMLVEFIGGWLSNSLALISDAAHMLTDIGAMLLSLFAIWVARRPVTPTMSW